MALDAERAEDDAEREVEALEHRALLDVKLEVSHQRSGLPACVGKPRFVEPCAGESRDECLPPAARRGEHAGVERAGDGKAAEQPDERAFLVGEVDRLERDRQFEPRLLHGSQDLEGRDDAERAVVPPAVRHGVEVRSEQERLRARRAA